MGDRKKDRYSAIEQSFARMRVAWQADIEEAIRVARKGNLANLFDYIRGRELTVQDREHLVQYIFEVARPRRSRRNAHVWDVAKIARFDIKHAATNGRRVPQEVREKIIRAAIKQHRHITGVEVTFESVDTALRRPIPKALRERPAPPNLSNKT